MVVDLANLDAAAVRQFAAALSTMPCAGDDSERIDRIRAFEELKSAAGAGQAVETADFAASQRAAQAAAGVPARRIGEGVAGQVALARRISPHQGGKYVGWACILTSEMPETLAALRAGRTSEWRALLVARETIWLSREHRAVVDRELGPRLEALGDRKVEAEAKKLAYRLDPGGFVDRIRNAANDRHVSIRPAPDVMARLSALMPVHEAIATHTALSREADRLRAAGDARGRGQLMADLLYERVTGQAVASGVPVEINLIMTDQTLLNGQDDASRPDAVGEAAGADVPRGANEPAQLEGYGPIPAPLARELATPGGDSPAWIRRLFRHPQTGELAAMETRRRFFTPAQRRFIRIRDGGVCRTPWCGAPIRHTDHVQSAEQGGPTLVANGAGLCERCNHAKQAHGWTTIVIPAPDGRHLAETTTPTGHRYRSRAPDPPGERRPQMQSGNSRVERKARELMKAALAA